MNEKIIKRSRDLYCETVRIRRDLHKYPEKGFCEYRTVSVIVGYLSELGYDVKYGNEVIDPHSVLGLPHKDILAREKIRAINDGADKKLVESLCDGGTAVVATISSQRSGGGKTVASRFDMDCNELYESDASDHIPASTGFSSKYAGCAHACGHDGHVAIGLTLARLLAENRDSIGGTVKLIFQPAEEGVRGANAMVAAGVVDDVDYFFSGHIGIAATKKGTMFASTGAFLCATKYDAEFFGVSSHAGLKPEEGKNALLAAAHATLALHTISRHGKGASRINVGVINGGTSRNVIPDYAKIQFETRGETNEINDYVKSRARSIISSSASMYDVDYKLNCVGHADAFVNDPEYAKEIADFANGTGVFSEVYVNGKMNASEDCTAFMNRVVERGGKASYFMFGTHLKSPHHTSKFDFDENVMTDAAAFLAILALKYSK